MFYIYKKPLKNVEQIPERCHAVINNAQIFTEHAEQKHLYHFKNSEELPLFLHELNPGRRYSTKDIVWRISVITEPAPEEQEAIIRDPIDPDQVLIANSDQKENLESTETIDTFSKEKTEKF